MTLPCSETLTHIEIINSDVSGPFATSFLCNQPTLQSIVIQGKQKRISLEGTSLVCIRSDLADTLFSVFRS
jgi:hypothetical protein